jgi:hypothetical protein
MTITTGKQLKKESYYLTVESRHRHRNMHVSSQRHVLEPSNKPNNFKKLTDHTQR